MILRPPGPTAGRGGVPAAADQGAGVRAGGLRVPGRVGGRAATPTRRSPRRLGRPAPADLGGQLGDPGRARACPGLRGGQGNVRGVRRAAGRARRRPSWCRTARSWPRTGAALLDGSLSLGRAARRRRPGAAGRPADAVGPLDHARGLAPPLRHLVLRRRPAAWPAGLAGGGGRASRIREAGGGPLRRWTAARAGEITLLPPTAVTLAELTAYRDVAGILAERRMITPLMPTVVLEDGQAWLAIPPAVEYPL